MTELTSWEPRNIHHQYMKGTAERNTAHYKALMDQHGPLRRGLYRSAAAPWEGDSTRLKADLIRTTQSWSDLMSDRKQPDESIPPCPISFEEQDIVQTMKVADEMEEADNEESLLRAMIGIGNDGSVPLDDYEEAMGKAARMKASALENADDDADRENTLRCWPFDDHHEDE